MASIRSLLQNIGDAADPMAAIKKAAFPGLSALDQVAIDHRQLPYYKGKVRELIQMGDKLWIYHSDRLSAFDTYIGLVPYKGIILAKLSEFWLKRANQYFPTHFQSSPHDRVLLTDALEPIRIEVIVRGYMAGSLARAYQKGVREFCGARLSEGLREFQALPKPIITPTTKAAAYEHDEEVSPSELIARGACTAAEWATISALALELFAFGQKVYAEHGWLLVDTKYEFGRDAQGKIKIIDEIHTPDSSRLWQKSSYESRLAQNMAPQMLDKEIVRRYLIDQGFSGEGAVPAVPAAVLIQLALVYLDVAEGLIGEELTLADAPLPLP